MAALNERLPHVDRVIQATLSVLGGETVNTAVEKGAAYSNPVAAMPSLHAAIPMMLALFFWSRVRWWVKALLAVYAVAMGLTLVYAGEHYVIDVLLGWAYAGLAVLAVSRFYAVTRRDQRVVQLPD
jgi:membrane-associated phospholipid phosphatase